MIKCQGKFAQKTHSKLKDFENELENQTEDQGKVIDETVKAELSEKIQIKLLSSKM